MKKEVIEVVTENSVLVKELEGVTIDNIKSCAFSGSYPADILQHVMEHSAKIDSALKDISKNCEVIAFNLYWIYRTKSYCAFGCNSITDYALTRFGLRKSTVYKFIEIAERFGNEDYTAFDSRYKGYSISKLSLLSDKNDSEISSMPISPDMSVREIKKIIKSYGDAFGFDSSISDNDNSDSELKQQKNKPDSQEAFIIDNDKVSLPETSFKSDTLKTDDFENNTSLSDSSGTASWSPDGLPDTSGNRFYDSYEYFISNCSCTSYTYKILTNFILNHYNPREDVSLVKQEYILYDDIIYSVQCTQDILTFSSMYCSDFYVTLRCANEYYTYANFSAAVDVYAGKKKLETNLNFRDFWINSILTDLLIASDFKCDKVTFKIQNNENPKEGGKDI
ncbi:MAG: hypothetical protein NC433_02985 [Clostridiales bacterium]|nr:hypothetical protein [Clostridiales bacterium]